MELKLANEMVFILWVLLFSNVINIECQSESATVQYLENVITKGIAESYVYPLPRDASAFRPNNNSTQVYGNFDYIIVGAGSAGCVLASRLSEDANTTVLLLEAGGLEDEFTEIPGLAFYSQGLQYNWNFNSTPQQKACQGTINRECPFPRGLGLGGTTIINGLMYVRGNKLDFDDWYNLGNPGWSYKDVLPFFKLSERTRIPNADPGYHGYDGYQNVEYTGYESPQLSAFLNANVELGHKIVDYNGKQQLGASVIQHNSINGTRQSAARAFLFPARNRPNLNVTLNSLAIRVLIGESNKTAYAVLFSRNRQLYVAYANKEVVASGGAFGSPQLLLLSGIGPANHLRKHGIKPVQALAVGDYFQDQLVFYALMFSTNYTAPVISLRENVELYLNDYGPLTVYANQQEMGFYQTKLEKRPGYPDIQLVFTPSNNTQSYMQRAFHLTDAAYDATFGGVDPTRSFTVAIVLIHPRSLGKVRLKSGDPYEYPSIDPNFFSDPYGLDLETMRLGVELVLNMVNQTKAFQSLNATPIYNPVPECRKHKYLSKEYWNCQLVQMALDNFHPTGSCRMGPDPSKGFVVNHQLKVHGVKGLRVADASIMPKTISGNTAAPTVMVAEKLAHMIRHGK